MPTTGRPANAGRGRTLARGLIVAGTVLLLLGGGLAAVASPIPVSIEYVRAHSVGGGGGGVNAPVLFVNLTDAPSFAPNALTAAAGATVTLALHNAGQFNHTFSLSDVANATLNRSWSPAQVDAFASHNTSENVSLPPDAFDNVTIGIPSTWSGDSFEYFSAVPYQFQAGMLGFLNITGAGGGTAVTIKDQTALSALAFVPDSIEVNATSFPVSVEVEVSNMGTNGHTWTLVAQPNTNVTPSGFASYFQAHPPAVSLNVPTSPGVTVTGNFTLSAKGAYMYICEISGHFAAGMFGFLYVGVPAPAQSAPPSTQIVAVWALAGAGAILGIGIALAAAAVYVGRFPPKSPEPRHH